jgi:hypothetical protein
VERSQPLIAKGRYLPTFGFVLSPLRRAGGEATKAVPIQKEIIMKSFKSAVATALLAGVAITGMSTAYAADVVIQFDPGAVQYGYQDGYWNRDHQWHSWERPEHVTTYRAVPNAQYYEYRHDRDPDMGWRTR